MQQLEDFIERPGRHGARLVLGRAVGTGQQRLRQLDVPVAIDVPDEAVGSGGGLVESVSLDRLRDLGGRLRRFVRDPAVERFLGGFRIETFDARRAVELDKARRVPQLGREVAVVLDVLRPEPDVVPGRDIARQREAQRIGAVLVDDAERIDHVALRLRHLGAGGVAHQAMDVDVVERHFFHEVQAHHHHARDPEEDDVEAGDQRRGRVEARKLRRLVRPAQRRERPQRRGEPGVEHVLVARNGSSSAFRA